LVSLRRDPQEQEEPSRFLDGTFVCFLIELKPALSYFTKARRATLVIAVSIFALQFIKTNTAATRCCWVIKGVDHHVVNVASLARIWSDQHVVNGSAALTNGDRRQRCMTMMMMMMRLLRKCGAREHREDAKSR